ncbi:MAG: hypothetical protein IT303_18845 [Dehalococcoidia bacterium]|nr:hypothetical protein [Dehalococcoidia bacterium]
MRIAPLQGVSSASVEWSGTATDSASYRPGTPGAAPHGETVAPPPAPVAPSADDTASQFEFDFQGQPATLMMRPSARPGHLQVMVRLTAPPAGDDIAPATVTIQANVSSNWLQSLWRGASSQNEQAVRVAESLTQVARDLAPAVVPGAPVIRGPVKPGWPQVWLPAEYPPPPDDPSLLAELAPEA